MLWWIILENIVLIRLSTLPVWSFKLAPSTAKIVSMCRFFSNSIVILIYFLRTPLHGFTFYNFNYPVCLLPSYLNHAFVYFNEISVTIYLMYPLHVTEFSYKLKLLHKLTTEHTLHSRVKLSITQNLDFCFS